MFTVALVFFALLLALVGSVIWVPLALAGSGLFSLFGGLFGVIFAVLMLVVFVRVIGWVLLGVGGLVFGLGAFVFGMVGVALGFALLASLGALFIALLPLAFAVAFVAGIVWLVRRAEKPTPPRALPPPSPAA